MAKIICVYRRREPAGRGRADAALITALANIVVPAVAELEVLRPLADDPLHVCGGVVNDRLSAVAILTVRCGEPLSAAQEVFEALAATIPARGGTDCALAVLHQRPFKPAPASGIHYLYFMKRKAGWCRADYSDYYTNHHFSFGLETRGIGYVQNDVDAEETAALAARFDARSISCDSVSEMRFASIEGFFAANDVPELGGRAAADEAHFVDRAASGAVSLVAAS